ncbi:hypothetical protein JCM3766R1_000900 [Sporobolomyces carnicolor]
MQSSFNGSRREFGGPESAGISQARDQEEFPTAFDPMSALPRSGTASTAGSSVYGGSAAPRQSNRAPSTSDANLSKPTTGERSGIKRSAKACNHCRKGKARCDGFDSYPCRRCREGGVECIFEGIPVEELLQRAQRKRDEAVSLGNSHSNHQREASTQPSALESRLRAIERELERLKAHNRTIENRLDTSKSGSARQSNDAPSLANSLTRDTAGDHADGMAREAFDLFWQHYAPLAPYISPTEDQYDLVRTRSPLLTHSIIAVASRFQEDREFVESNRAEAVRLLRETLFTDTPLSLDDLKGILLFSAWLGRGAPPGHSVSLALQLDLPKSLDRLLASIAHPHDVAANAFDLEMPAVRIWLTLYAQDLWLSFAMGRRSMVTIDLSITNARLLLNFSALRPVDARLIAQSELVTILGIVQETFLKMQHQTTTETVSVVMQANGHLDNWIRTWSEWANAQEESSARYVLASLTMLLQGGRFYSNTLGLRDITKPEELLPMHMPCLRTALDAAVRIQGIHPAQKIAHAAEFTLITLSTSALFLLKMIKLTPHAFSPYATPSYPSFPFHGSPATTGTGQRQRASEDDPSSPDASAGVASSSGLPDSVAPSIAQALDAVRHSAGLLASVPQRQRSYHAAVVAALHRLEVELSIVVPPPATPESLFVGMGRGTGGGGGGGGGGGNDFDDRDRGAKRPRGGTGDNDDDDEGLSEFAPRPPPPPPAVASDFDFTNYGRLQQARPPPFGADPFASKSVASYGANDEQLQELHSQGRGGPVGAARDGDDDDDEAGRARSQEQSLEGLTDLSIASLVGTQAFWSWQSTLPGDINAGLSSIFA